MKLPHLPPPRILIAIAATAVAVVVLALNALLGGDADEAPDATSSTTTAVAPTTVPVAVHPSAVVAPDWYPKRSSRYSDRGPGVTITTLPSTTTTLGDADQDDADHGDGDQGDGGGIDDGSEDG